ncbi:MAG: glycosyltransferase, partial [Usitatibacter sp.]
MITTKASPTPASGTATHGLLLSAVVVTKNRAAYLERFLEGLFREIDGDYPNTEVVVIDGGSRGGTAEIRRKYEGRIAY